MADLEDRILKKNIPGKYSWWDEYLEQPREGDDEDEGGTAEVLMPQSDDLNLSTRATSTRRSGPKGVREDYNLHQEEKKRQAIVDQLEKEELRERNTVGVKMKPGEVSIALDDIRRRLEEEKQFQRDKENNESDSDDDDDEFMCQYRKRRLLELQKTNACPLFEGVEDVDPLGYSRAVDETDPRVTIIVHLYETYIPACRTLMPMLESLSRNSLQCMRFLSLRASKASVTLDLVALPAVLVHRRGQLIANLTPITNHLPGENFTIQDLEDLLIEQSLKS